MGKHGAGNDIRMLPVPGEQAGVRFYRMAQVARITNASKTEVHRWIISGRLRAVRPAGTRSWYIPVEALEEFMSSGEAA
jgi:excisionase family DNA binding protein